MASSEPVWLRYLPGFCATVGGAVIIAVAPRPRRVSFTILATLVGLLCMEAEYWLAFGFPRSELAFVVTVVVITLASLAIGYLGAVFLGLAGLVFFAYVNLRYGAPYLLDYVMPVFYGLMLGWSRRELGWTGRGIRQVGRPELAFVVAMQILAAWRTTTLDKWGWLAGRHWR